MTGGSVRYDFQFVNETIGHRPRMLNSQQYMDCMVDAGVFGADAFAANGWNGQTDTDWFDVTFTNGTQQKHTFTFEGAGEKGSFLASVSYLDNNGPVRGDADTYKRLSGNINADYQIKPWLKVGTTAILERWQTRSVSASDQWGAMLTSIYALDPLTPNTVAPDQLANYANMMAHQKELLTNENGDYYGLSAFYTDENVHPMIMRDRATDKYSGFNVTGSAYALFNPWKPLSITSRFGYKLSSQHDSHYEVPYFGSVQANSPNLNINAQNSTTTYYQWENFANYNQTFGEVHNVTAMAGLSFQKEIYSWTYGAGNTKDDVYAIWTWDTSMNGNYKWVYGNGPTTIGNPDLSWETMTQWDLGFDARFFNNRFTFGFDYFHKTTDGLLVYGVVPTLSLGGVTSPINAGGVLNEGVEFDLGWQDRIGDFRYSINANVSTLRNKVTKIHPSVPIINGTSFSNVTVTRFEVGEKVWHFYGYDYAGVDAETGRALYWVNRDGQRVTTDAPEESDKTNIGDAIPDVTVGLNINLAYKGFDFNLSGSGQFGNDIYMNLQRQDRLTSNRMYEVFYKNRWTASNPGGAIPAASAINQGTDAERYLFSSAMVQNGSFFKIRQMQLGYTIPRNITRKAFIDNFRVYLSLDDFFTITSYKGLDPEISAGTGSSQGLDMGGYPVTKKFSVGFNVTF